MDTGKNQGHWGSLKTATVEEGLQSRNDTAIASGAGLKQEGSPPKLKKQTKIIYIIYM